MPAGARESLRLLPPLNISGEECDLALGVLDNAIEEAYDVIAGA